MKIFFDEAFILKKEKDFFIGISKNYGKVLFSSTGIEKKFPALNGGFFINYNFEKIYNYLKKITLYPHNINLDEILNYKNLSGIFQLIIFYCDQFYLYGIKCDKTWNLLNELKKNESNSFNLFNLSLDIFNSLNGNFYKKFPFNNLEMNKFINEIKKNFFSEKQFKIFEKLIIYIFKKELNLNK